MEGGTSETYEAVSSPAQKTASRITYLIDPEGRIALTYPRVDPKVHPQEVLEDLERLQSESG